MEGKRGVEGRKGTISMKVTNHYFSLKCSNMEEEGEGRRRWRVMVIAA
jgi:hypothetical protein